MSAAPTRIWINAGAATMPDWVQEQMTTGDIAGDGSFMIETPDGSETVRRGFAIFELAGGFYTCLPREVQPKLASITGEPLPALAAPEAKAPVEERPLNIKPPIGLPPSPQFLAIASLKVDDTYQRSIEGGASQKLINKIAENWDWRLCLPLLVSRRGGELFVIDGQHRLEGAKLRHDIPHLPVVVFDFDDEKAEAELFVQANRSRRSMSKLDEFYAALVAGDKRAIEVNEVVTAAGLAVGRVPAWQYWKPGEVVFISSIQRLLKSAGRPTVQSALNMIGRAFEGSVLISGGAIFEGLVAFMQARAADAAPIDEALMEVVLSEVGLPGWKQAVEAIDGADPRRDAMSVALARAYSEAEAE